MIDDGVDGEQVNQNQRNTLLVNTLQTGHNGMWTI